MAQVIDFKQKPKAGPSVTDELVKAGAYITVSEAARKLDCSDRRVRTLLSQGRLLGEYFERERRWLVNSPIRVTYGKRGPKLGQKPSPSPSSQPSAGSSFSGEE